LTTITGSGSAKAPVAERRRALPPETRERPMCNRCDEIDAKIARYRNIANGINDRPMIQRLVAFIADMHCEKIALHPEPPKK
jgi:hypothetical protein